MIGELGHFVAQGDATMIHVQTDHIEQGTKEGLAPRRVALRLVFR